MNCADANELDIFNDKYYSETRYENAWEKLYENQGKRGKKIMDETLK
jgi:hypothetical protein